MCDQLTAIGHPVTDDDKSHWFLCGLGSSFETFSTTQRLITPRPSFRDLVAQAESHELFLKSVTDSSVAPVAFNTTSSYSSSTNNSGRGRGRNTSRGGGSSQRGRGRGGNRRPLTANYAGRMGTMLTIVLICKPLPLVLPHLMLISLKPSMHSVIPHLRTGSLTRVRLLT